MVVTVVMAMGVVVRVPFFVAVAVRVPIFVGVLRGVIVRLRAIVLVLVLGGVGAVLALK